MRNILQRIGKRGLPLGKLNYIMATFTLLISVLLLFATRRTSSGYAAMRNMENNYIEWQQCANDLLAASDYLTEQVRGFVTTGNRDYLDCYFEEINVTKRREAALETLHEGLGGTDSYLRAKAAVKQSESLTSQEIYAIRLALDAFGEDPQTYPRVIRTLSILPQDDALGQREKLDLARSMVFDNFYVRKKAAISENMQLCFADLVKQNERQQTAAEGEMNLLLHTQQTLITLLIAIILMIVAMTSILVINPLIRSVLHIQDEEAIPIRGSSEFRFLASTYNIMFETNREKKEKLAYEASHDKLTGLYNRAGYDFLLKNTVMDTCALLIIDVDKFKNVNDTYGHDMGDRVLAHVASVLRDSVRPTDYICRIGGDEFAAIMVRSGSQFKGLIDEKVKRINQKLQNPENGLPPTSVSVGTAFGDSKHSTGDIVKDADLALYKVKQNGRCGCAFYD